MPGFAARLIHAITEKRTPLVVGLDPRIDQLPENFLLSQPDSFPAMADAFESFCKSIIDIVSPLVPAVKPQSAFFERLGSDGMRSLQTVIKYARSKGLLVIMDAKRGDIGSTAVAYAQAFLGSAAPWPCDALTVNPYLGGDSLQPFLQQCRSTDTGIFVLVRTSNPGGAMFQELLCDGKRVFEWVADHVQDLSMQTCANDQYGDVGAVVGATHPDQLDELRRRMPNTFFLVPGFGAQGGTAADIAGAFDENGLGAVINSSRGIIFANARPEYSSMTWQQAVDQATRDAIEQIASATSAGKLNQ